MKVESALRSGVLLLVCFMLFLAACSNDTNSSVNDNVANGSGDNDNNESLNVDEEAELEEVTLTVRLGPWGNWERDWEEPLLEEYPHITLEYVEGSLEDLIAAQTIPDILWYWGAGGQRDTAEYELGFDMTELIDQFNFDLSRYDQRHLGEWTAWTGGEIWALPFFRDHHALTYNKDIFDNFGVPYPEDGMTWQEVVDLASEVTGEMDGVQYQGLYLPETESPLRGQIPNLIDPDTDEPIWTQHDKAREYFDLFERNYTIPGNPYIPVHTQEGGWEEMFLEDQTLAMIASWTVIPEEDSGLNWDVATWPVWEDQPNSGPPFDGWGMGISSASENKEEAFRAMNFWYQDERLLTQQFAGGGVSTPFPHQFEDGSVDQLLEERDDVWSDKNTDALYALRPADVPESYSDYEHMHGIGGALYEFMNESELDVNSFLDQKHDEISTNILEEKAME